MSEGILLHPDLAFSETLFTVSKHIKRISAVRVFPGISLTEVIKSALQ